MINALINELFAPLKEKDKTVRNIDLPHHRIKLRPNENENNVCVLLHSNDDL